MDYNGFGFFIYNNAAFKRAIENTSNKLEATILIAFCFFLYYINTGQIYDDAETIIVTNWNKVVDGISSGLEPTTLEIDDWNTAATNLELGFSFASDGKIIYS